MPIRAIASALISRKRQRCGANTSSASIFATRRHGVSGMLVRRRKPGRRDNPPPPALPFHRSRREPPPRRSAISRHGNSRRRCRPFAMGSGIPLRPHRGAPGATRRWRSARATAPAWGRDNPQGRDRPAGRRTPARPPRAARGHSGRDAPEPRCRYENRSRQRRLSRQPQPRVSRRCSRSPNTRPRLMTVFPWESVSVTPA